MSKHWPTNPLERLGQKISDTYRRFEAFIPALSFLAGIAVDLATVGRIDQWSNILILGTYLCIAGSFLGLEMIALQRAIGPLRRPWRLLWSYHQEISHFCLGNLLSALAILFFKSASVWSASVFLLLIVALLVANQFGAVRRRGIALRIALFALVLTSYLACLIPVFWGEVGTLPFMLAIATACGSFGMLFSGVARLIPAPRQLIKPVILPFVGVISCLTAFYFFRIIPPVPLSLRSIGIYRDVIRSENHYVVTRLHENWQSWFRLQDEFPYRPGDRLYCFFSVFSPVGFRDQLKVRWLYRDPNQGWHSSDAVLVPITGGRLEGYRGFAYKSNIQPGEWRILIETSDEREIGRIDVAVVTDTSDQPRVFINETL